MGVSLIVSKSFDREFNETGDSISPDACSLFHDGRRQMD